LNFAVDGAGLANWWSVLTRIVEAEHYQIDGVIFAVWGDDLRRTFTIMDHKDYGRALFWRVPSWDPRDFPSTRAEADLHLRELSFGYIVTKEEFEAALESRSWRQFPLLPPLGYDYVRRAAKRLVRYRHIKDFGIRHGEDARKQLIADIQRSFHSIGVPAFVVSVPSLEELLAKGDRVEVPASTQEFATLLGAECINGGLAFQGLSCAEIRRHWFAYDGHWGQEGSDRFGRFMVDVLLAAIR
jgi:hypothetical protein